jgi:hypothetical protein
MDNCAFPQFLVTLLPLFRNPCPQSPQNTAKSTNYIALGAKGGSDAAIFIYYSI